MLPLSACHYGLAGTKRVHIRGLAGTRGYGRRLASHRDTFGETVTPSLEGGGRSGGKTNPEIGAQLFLSPRTVEWHLTKVFGKLGISSRKELSAALSDVA